PAFAPRPPGAVLSRSLQQPSTEEAINVYSGLRLAATVAPRSQQASRSLLVGGPSTATGAWSGCHCRPVAMVSTARTAPVVSWLPCTNSPYGDRALASRHG